MAGTACAPDLEYPKNEDRIPYTSADVHWPESNPLPNNSVVFRPAHIKNILNYGFPQLTSQRIVFL
tara:strand:+ start:186 stop:383 length:198 start_codon:yes stop_codon:yes gene_type:complete